MVTWQSAVNVNCCASKREEDDISDDERTEGETQKAAEAMCVAVPWWDGGISVDFAPATLQRSVSNATTIPCHLRK